MSDAVPNARGQREEKEDFIAPVLLPLPPARVYFLFGAPVETDTLPGRGKEKEPAEKMYQEVRQEGWREGREGRRDGLAKECNYFFPRILLSRIIVNLPSFFPPSRPPSPP